jgi:7,8-dihydro-6-hydroxymethylpterin-pyrophosphokinase
VVVAHVDAIGGGALAGRRAIGVGARDDHHIDARQQRLEQAAGRERPYRNAPRTLDLDLLLYGSARISSAVLTVPHPRLRERAFVLLPLAELAPELVTASELAAVAHQRIAPLPGASSTS